MKSLPKTILAGLIVSLGAFVATQTYNIIQIEANEVPSHVEENSEVVVSSS